jgi:hypothetical protein
MQPSLSSLIKCNSVLEQAAASVTYKQKPEVFNSKHTMTPTSNQHWLDATNSPIVSPCYTSPQKRRLTSELRQALPKLMLVGDDSSSSVLSEASFSSSASILSPFDRQKGPLSFQKQLKIAQEPLQRMLQARHKQQQQLQQPQVQQQLHKLPPPPRKSCASTHSSSAGSSEKVVSPRPRTLYAPRVNQTIVSGLHFL